MSALPTLPALLGSLSTSLNLALEAADNVDSASPPKGGLSLLDVKNELLVSYLQNLVFLILLRIRHAQDPEARHRENFSSVVEKLVELRLYLEKGVRPLEEKLRFQINKALRAAEDAERATKNKAANRQSSDDESSGSEEESSDESESTSDDEVDRGRNARPAGSRMKGGVPAKIEDDAKDTSLPYRPPKSRPVLMPSERKERAERRIKSRTMDEYIDSELLPTPVEQPSIGTNIAGHGRTVKTAAQKREEDERREYEETNLVRLPKPSKKEQKKKNALEARRSQMSFGGEEWRDLGEGLKRIHALTQRRGPGGTKALLDRSRKRDRDSTDGPRGSGSTGIEIGERFQKRLKTVEGGRRDRGKKKR